MPKAAKKTEAKEAREEANEAPKEKKEKKLSPYNIFCKEEMARLKEAGVDPKERMSMVAKKVEQPSHRAFFDR